MARSHVLDFLEQRLPEFRWSVRSWPKHDSTAYQYSGVYGSPRKETLDVSVFRRSIDRIAAIPRSGIVFYSPEDGYRTLAVARKLIEAQEFILRALPDFLETLD